MPVHLLNGQMQDLPQVHLGELPRHLLGKYPIGDGGTLDYLSLEHLVHQHDHHLLLVVPQLEHVPHDADLSLLGLGQYLKHVVELGDGGEAMGEAFRA